MPLAQYTQTGITIIIFISPSNTICRYCQPSPQTNDLQSLTPPLLIPASVASLFIIFNFSVTTSMRRRSGALHCESELDFLQLAEAAHDHIGIFYDERTNRKIMTHLRPPKATPVEVHNPELSLQKEKQDYSGFEFGLESQAEREEREQLSRANLEITRQLNLGIVAKHTDQVWQRLWGSQHHASHQCGPFDLITEKRNKTIVKYWIFRWQHNLTQQPVIDLYLKRCQVVIEEGERWKVTKSEGEWGELAAEVEKRLNGD